MPYSSQIPTQRLALGHLPTPVHPWKISGLPCELYIKQDSCSGSELSGNKIRKLEFLMAEALAQGADCIITLGGIQSNHARATAVAATMLGLECHLVSLLKCTNAPHTHTRTTQILRTSRTCVDDDPGLVGNLLVERMAGAHVHLVSKEEYARVGQTKLAALLAAQLTAAGKKPYVIPVGGSNALGTWGYLDAIAELQQQVQGGLTAFTDIVMVRLSTEIHLRL